MVAPMRAQVPMPWVSGVVRQVQPSAPSIGAAPFALLLPEELPREAHGSKLGSVNFEVLWVGESST